jgi:LPPG:FO 2-phospho-L-lactate transferase
MGSVVALAGGVGAARLLRGLVRVFPPEELTIIGNTGDDFELYGLHISPDLDIVIYTLAGIVDEVKGWGLAGDTFNCLGMLERLGFETWFKLGDRDLATHVTRTKMLRDGLTLAQATAKLCRRLNVKVRLVPMSNNPVRTKILTEEFCLDFQEYFVKRRTKDEVKGVVFEGSDKAEPAIGLVDAIRNAERVAICPSNPVLSVAPILSVQAIRQAIMKTEARVVGVSPIVGGKAIRGPADRVMASLGFEASAFGVAKYYGDLLDHLIIDKIDEKDRSRIESLGVEVSVEDSVMRCIEDSVRLATAVMTE